MKVSRVTQASTTVSTLCISAYIATQMLSDIASLKIAYVSGFSVDGGTFIYPFTFTLRDLVHKQLGRRAAQVLILAAGAINLLMAALLAFVTWLPADPTWVLQEAFAAVLGPVWRIVIASIVAEVLSELTDTEVYSFWVRRVTSKAQWTRVLASNSVSILLDSFVFGWIAFGQWGGLFPAGLPSETVWSIIWANVLIKGAVTLVSLPGIYLVPELEQKVE